MINIPYQQPIHLPPMPYFPLDDDSKDIIKQLTTYISGLHQTLNNLIMYTNSLGKVFTEVDIHLTQLSIVPNKKIQEKLQQDLNLLAEDTLKAYKLKLEELKKQYELD